MRLKVVKRTNSIAPGDPAKLLKSRKYLIAFLCVFLSCSALFATPIMAAKASFVRIIIVASRPEAEDLLSRIGKGESFAALAKERSLDEKSRIRYGEMEAADLEKLENALKDCIAVLKEGEVSGVIPVGDNKFALAYLVDLDNYREGSRAFRAKDFRTAEEKLLKHIELNPDAVKARIMLAKIYEGKKSFENAETNYGEALRFGPKNEEAYLRLADLLSRKEDSVRAKEICEEGLKNIPDSKLLQVELGKATKRLAAAEKNSGKDLKMEERKPSEAVTSAKEPSAESLIPTDNERKMAPEKETPPIKAPEQAAQQEPQGVTPQKEPIAETLSPTINEYKADSKIEAAKGPEEAAPPKPLEKPAAAQLPDKDNARKAPVKPSGKSVNLRIIIISGLADAQKILSNLESGTPFAVLAKEKSIDENSREEYGYLGEVDPLSLNPAIQETLSHLKEGQTSGIISLGEDKYALIQVTNSGAYREGERAFIEGDFKTAEEKLLAYVELNPDSAKALTMLGKIYEDRKEFSRAIEMYRKAISFSPKVVLVYERLARIYLYIGDYQKAKNVYIEGLKQVPSSTVLEEGIEMANILLIGGGRVP